MHDVKFLVTNIKGTGPVDFGEEDSVLFCRHIVINDEEFKSEGDVRLTVEGTTGFLNLEIYDPPEELAARFTPDEYLDGTDESLLLLPVRKLSFLEAPIYV